MRGRSRGQTAVVRRIKPRIIAQYDGNSENQGPIPGRPLRGEASPRRRLRAVKGVLRAFRGLNADGHDIRVMVLLVANRGREVPQQPK